MVDYTQNQSNTSNNNLKLLLMPYCVDSIKWTWTATLVK